jgi:hypothetical protein
MLKAQEKRDEARAEMEARQGEMDRARSTYDKLARKAEAFKGAQTGDGPGSKSHAVANAALQPSGGEERLQILLPVALELRSVPVPPLTGCEFTQTRQAGLWDTISDKTAAEAIGLVEARFTWHYSGAGRTFLQVTPLLLLAVLVFLYLRIGKAAGSYNPFDREIDVTTLPSVGLGPAPLNFVIIVALPSLACILCIWALMQIDVIPAVPILCALLVLGLGALGHVRMNELRNLRDALVRGRRASQTPAARA